MKYKKPVQLTIAVILGLSIAFTVSASDTRSERNISTSKARKIVKEALKICKEDGFNVTAAVVDTSGVIVAQLRANEAGPHTVSGAFRKAYTALSLKRSTGEAAELVANVPTLAGLQHIDNILLLQGGVPIEVNGKVVGGIGVAGAPGGQFDEDCALEAIDSVLDSDKD